MAEVKEKIKQQQNYSTLRLSEIRNRFKTMQLILDRKDLCIYTTGSYGRLEAWEESDLDIFFINLNPKSISKIDKTKIDSFIIDVCEKMGFPSFSNDGQYLEIHENKDIINEIGSQTDDYRNFFTTRMLLLLESRPLINDDSYNKVLEEVVNRYYTDFNDHIKDFTPVFLVNDVMRFWRTMCLNYEHKRTRFVSDTEGLTEKQIEEKKVKIHLKNLKLKFSRKLTCFSFLINLIWNNTGTIIPQEVLRISKLTPLNRLMDILDKVSDEDVKSKLAILLQETIADYFWFLEKTQKPEKETLSWFAQKENRDEAFERSRGFSKKLFEIIKLSNNEKILTYFIF
jgi:hypothetical protein